MMIEPQGIRVRRSVGVEERDVDAVYIRLCDELNHTYEGELTIEAAERLHGLVGAVLAEVKAMREAIAQARTEKGA